LLSNPAAAPSAHREKGSEEVLGGVALEYDPTAGPTKFMVGTEQGSVLNCNRKAKNPADRVGASYTGHHGPVLGVHRWEHVAWMDIVPYGSSGHVYLSPQP
jgi:hypothetical protein